MIPEIILDAPSAVRYHVLKNRRFGEECTIALIKTDQRDVLKSNDATNTLEPVLKPNGKPKQELVVYGVVITSTMIAGIGGEEGVPEPGDIVRKILRGRTFGDWIEIGGSLKPRKVGDIINFTSDTAVVYDANGKPSQEITDQATLDAVPRGRSVGVYGPLTIRRPVADETPWVQKAVDAYHAMNAPVTPVIDRVDPAADPFGDAPL